MYPSAIICLCYLQRLTRSSPSPLCVNQTPESKPQDNSEKTVSCHNISVAITEAARYYSRTAW